MALFLARRKYDRIFELKENERKEKILKFPSRPKQWVSQRDEKKMYPNIYSILCQIVLESFPNTIEQEHYEKFYVLMGEIEAKEKGKTVA